MNMQEILNVKSRQIAPYAQEVVLLELLADIDAQKVLCTSPGLAQFGGAMAERAPSADVCCKYLDLYRMSLAQEYWQDAPGRLWFECSADLNGFEMDLVALPLSASGEAELVRDLLQSGHECLRVGGKLLASTQNVDDVWLGEQVRRLFPKVERRAFGRGVVYAGIKTRSLKKLKNYGCEFAFRDRGRLIRAYSRPGVFSHRHIDPGARHLIDVMHVEPGARVLDVGCGAGTVALAAAFRSENVNVHAVDSNARAIACTQRGAELNGLSNVTVEVNAHG